MGGANLGNSGYVGPWGVGPGLSNALFSLLVSSPTHAHALQRAVTGPQIRDATTNIVTQTATRKYQFSSANPQRLLLNADMCMYYDLGEPAVTSTDATTTTVRGRVTTTTTVTTVTHGVLPCSTTACTGAVASGGKLSIYAPYTASFAASAATFFTQFSNAWSKMLKNGQTTTRFTCTLNRLTTTCTTGVISAATETASTEESSAATGTTVTTTNDQVTVSTTTDGDKVVISQNSDWSSVAIAGLVLGCVSTITVFVLLVVVFSRRSKSETF